MTTKLVASLTAIPIVVAVAGCGAQPTASQSLPLPPTSAMSESADSGSIAGQGANGAQSSAGQSSAELGPAAKVANQIDCKNARAGDGSLATATTVFCTDGQKGYTLTVYGSNSQYNAAFKKIENSVKETGETISIMIGSNWILRGTESQQIGEKIESSAANAGGRIVTFSDEGAAQMSPSPSASSTANPKTLK